MGHIGGEIARARIWEDKKDLMTRNRALERALELIDITLDDPRNYKKGEELSNMRKLLANRSARTAVFNITLKDLEKYCLDFALVANKNK